MCINAEPVPAFQCVRIEIGGAKNQIDDVRTGRWMEFFLGQLFSPEGFWVLYHA
jgi:hypothetical protein